MCLCYKYYKLCVFPTLTPFQNYFPAFLFPTLDVDITIIKNI